MRLFFPLLFILFSYNGKAQTIRPSTFNIGGGTSDQTVTNLTVSWSIGESAMIGSFTNSNIQFNAGVLQPNIDVVTSILNLGTVVFGNQITIGPNPSFADLNLIFKMQKSGNAIVAIYDATSKLARRITVEGIYGNQSKTIVLNDLPTGSYFFKIYFQPNQGIAQEGIYKIVRL